MQLTSAQECSDLHDRVYGIVGVAPRYIAARIQPDYKTSAATAYKTAVLKRAAAVKRLSQLECAAII